MIFFLPMSGNLGDTCNILPVLSGLYKSTGEKIHLIVRDKMKNFKGFKQLIECQEFISKLDFESTYENTGENVIPVYLMSNYDTHFNRPYETIRYENYLKSLGYEFEVNDDFILDIPYKKTKYEDTELYVIGDRSYSKNADTRRSFDILKNTGYFSEHKCVFLEYNNDLIHNLNIIRNSIKPFITTFTGIAILADLMYKETMVCYGTDIENWDGFPIDKSYKQHFYRNRNCELVNLNELIKGELK
jgi:hypothetical protein